MKQLKWVHYTRDQWVQGYWRLMEYDRPDDDYYRRCILSIENTGHWRVRFTNGSKSQGPFDTAEDAKAWALAEVRLS